MVNAVDVPVAEAGEQVVFLSVDGLYVDAEALRQDLTTELFGGVGDYRAGVFDAVEDGEGSGFGVFAEAFVITVGK